MLALPASAANRPGAPDNDMARGFNNWPPRSVPQRPCSRYVPQVATCVRVEAGYCGPPSGGGGKKILTAEATRGTVTVAVRQTSV